MNHVKVTRVTCGTHVNHVFVTFLCETHGFNMSTFHVLRSYTWKCFKMKFHMHFTFVPHISQGIFTSFLMQKNLCKDIQYACCSVWFVYILCGIGKLQTKENMQYQSGQTQKYSLYVYSICRAEHLYRWRDRLVILFHSHCRASVYSSHDSWKWTSVSTNAVVSPVNNQIRCVNISKGWNTALTTVFCFCMNKL